MLQPRPLADDVLADDVFCVILFGPRIQNKSAMEPPCHLLTSHFNVNSRQLCLFDTDHFVGINFVSLIRLQRQADGWTNTNSFSYFSFQG